MKQPHFGGSDLLVACATMDVAVIGASGAVGRAVCGQLLATRTLTTGERLQLVGRRGGASETGVFGLAIDLADAYADSAPQLEPVLDIRRIQADIIVMVAGDTVSDDPAALATRDAVAHRNLPLFEELARDLAEHGNGHEIVLIQSNPVELAVEVFARRFGSKRVIGAGAYNDSLRLRREVADSFLSSAWSDGRRPIVSGYMLGEHGPGAVPMWSTLRAQGIDAATWSDFIAHIRGSRSFGELAVAVTRARGRLSELLVEHRGEAAYEFVTTLPPDIRALVKAWYAHWAGRTSTATAHCVVDIVQELRSGHRVVLPLQVAGSDQDWPGLAGVVGLAVDIDLEGWHYTVPMQVPDDEHEALLGSIREVNQRLADWQA